MSETNAGQVTFTFGSSLPAGPDSERPTRPHERRFLGRQAEQPAQPSGRATAPGWGLPGAAGASSVIEDEPGTGLRWLTAAEATAYLGFPTRKALYAAVERGQIPARKLGRRLRFRLEELDALLGRPR